MPWNIGLTIPAAEAVGRAVGVPPAELGDWMGNHLFSVEPLAADAWTEVKPGHFRDEFGVVWNRTVDPDIGVIEHYQLGERSLAGYSLPDAGSRRALGATTSAASSAVATATPSAPSASRSSSARGRCAAWQPLLMDMVEAPEFVDELARRHLRVQPAPRGARGELGHRRGLLRRRLGPAARPDHGPEAVAPLHQASHASACTAAVKAGGKCVFIHSCGDVQELFPDLIEAGLDVLQPLPARGDGRRRDEGPLRRPADLPRRHEHPAGSCRSARRTTCARRRNG